MAAKKRRADELLLEKLNLESLELARALIMEGRALSGDSRICRTMELDPKYATVIVERFHQEYPDQEITVLRDGQTLPYDSIAESK